jgi:plastocyanin
MRSLFATACGALGLLLSVSCGGGSSYNGGNPSGPSGSPPPASNATTIQIVGSSGSQAFDPNPASASGSRNVVWRNTDGLVHRIVANDGSFDTGNIGPGATSAAVAIPAAGARYHCSLHTSMVGAVTDSGGTAPPCSGLYC